jgi:hypothetical protein
LDILVLEGSDALDFEDVPFEELDESIETESLLCGGGVRSSSASYLDEQVDD